MDNIDWIKAFRLVFIISVNNHTEIINKDINRIDESYEKDVEDYVLNRRETGKSWKNLTVNERNEYEDWENYYYSEDIVNDKYHPDIFGILFVLRVQLFITIESMRLGKG